MKLILRQYIEGLKERDQLDVILPTLLSELGFHVLTTPGKGTRQFGVDFAAVGPDERDGGKEKFFMFVIKSGDLTRRSWNGSQQAVRQSINDIIDSYMPNLIPPEFSEHQKVICLCLGGEVKEPALDPWVNFRKREEERNSNLKFREWNGDKLASLLMTGALKQEHLPKEIRKELRAAFQKSVAMVDQPDVSYNFFAEMAHGLRKHDGSDPSTLTYLRQLYVCVWILYVWGRDSGNLDGPYRASELSLLHSWEVCRRLYDKKGAHSKKCLLVLDQILNLYINISIEFFDGKISQYADKPFAISIAANTRSPVDVNLILYELLGRICLLGFWAHWLAENKSGEERDNALIWRNKCMVMVADLINANPSLKSPIRDDYEIEIALFMMLAGICDRVEAVSGFIEEIAYRLDFSLRRRGAYPIPSEDYHELIVHPVDQSDDYFKSKTIGSILYPLLIVWLDALGKDQARSRISKTLGENLGHCTHQVWVPDDKTDQLIWIGNREHGASIPGLKLHSDAKAYTDVLTKVFEDYPAIKEISAFCAGYWPMFLLACRHYRVPVPPQLWIWNDRPSNGDRV